MIVACTRDGIHCREPDFTLKAMPDGATFQVQRLCLMKSQVFQDMFALCEPPTDNTEPTMDIPESSGAVQLLLDLLHSPPKPVVSSNVPPAEDDRQIIPIPIIPQMLTLVDKYLLSADIGEAIHSHILAQAPRHPLRAYGLLTLLEMPSMASKASAFLMKTPLDAYSVEEIQENIPDLRAYHKVVQLQALRTRRLKEVLSDEPLFPHGYGRCDAHEQKAVLAWEQRKQRIAWRLHVGTDVAGEMADVIQNLDKCPTCLKAADAAIAMLSYKCNKCPKRIDQLLKVDVDV